MKEFVALQAKFKASEKSWAVKVDEVEQVTFDLSVKNPNAPGEAPLREPAAIIKEIAALDAEAATILDGLRGLL